MDASNSQKEVLFGEYCKTCEYRDNKESEDPCWDCLAEPFNIDSHKPIKWQEAFTKKNTNNNVEG